MKKSTLNMLLICDKCKRGFKQIMKIPCGFYIEEENDKYIFVIPEDESVYCNVCLDCVLLGYEKEL